MSAVPNRIDPTTTNNETNKHNVPIPEQSNQAQPVRRQLSVDAWAVILSLALAGLVRFGVLKHISW